jgi:hypothetical protein
VPIPASAGFGLSATFTPVASPSRSPLASPSKSKAPQVAPLSLSVSEVLTVTESISISIDEIESISITMVESIVVSKSEIVYESNSVMTEESRIEVIVYGSDSQTYLSQSVVVISIETVIRSVEVVTITTRTMVSSLLVSLTFVRVEMPVYVTVVSQVVLAVDRKTSLLTSRVSNALLIGVASGGFVFMLILIVFGIWFRRQGKDVDQDVLEMDIDYLDDDIVTSTSRSRSTRLDREKAKDKTVKPDTRIFVKEIITVVEEEDKGEDDKDEEDEDDFQDEGLDLGEELQIFGLAFTKQFIWRGRRELDGDSFV